MIKTLNIGKEKVTVDADISFRYIEINFTGKMFVNRLLPIDYLFGKGRSKLLILNVNNSDEIHSDLFYYIGSCNITSANYLEQSSATFPADVEGKEIKDLFNLSGKVLVQTLKK